MSDKTEAPTHRRLEDARQEGQVARSLELNTAVILLVGTLLLQGPGAQLVRLIKEMMVSVIMILPDFELTGTWMKDFAVEQLMAFVPVVGIILIGLMISGVSVTLIQTGFLWASKKIGFDFKRINPITGFQRIFSAQGLIELGRALLKLALVGYVAYSFLNSHMQDILYLGNNDLASGVTEWSELAISLGIRVGSSYLALAAADYAFQRWRFMRSMRMTKEEIKEDFKRSEGDPFLRGRIRAQQRKIARTRMMSNVPKAKVVVTNPTHFAVAVKYEMSKDGAPKVVAKGMDELAQKIKKIAAENNVPLHEDVQLARALYKSCEIGDEIPAKLFKAVAQILAYIYQMKNLKKRRSIV